MGQINSGDNPPPGYISIVAAFRAFQKAKRGPDWGNDYPLSSGGEEADKVLQAQWRDRIQKEAQLDESEFVDAIMSERLEVVVQYPDGRFFAIPPEHIAESMWPPSALITTQLPGFPGDTTVQAIADHKGDPLARHAGRTPLVKRTEFTVWLGQVSAATSKRKKPGPKPKLDKEKFFMEVKRYVEEEGVPNPELDPQSRQADLERHMMQWHHETVGESTNRKYVAEALCKIETHPRK